MGDIVLQIFNGDFLENDLGKLRADPTTANDVDLLNAFMDQVAESQDLLWKLAKWKEDHWSPHLNCRAIDCFQNDGYNVYRIRPLNRRLSKYRILYAYNSRDNEFHFLALVIKFDTFLSANTEPDSHYNYEPNHPISIRVRDEYDNSRFPNTKH